MKNKMTRKTASPAKGFDFKEIDWSYVTPRKADFIYCEAKTVKRDIINNLNVLKETAFKLLTLALSLITVISSLIFPKWASVPKDIKAGAIGFCFFLLLAIFASILTLWPRRIANPTSAPNAYFTDNYYTRPFLNIILGNIVGASNDIAENRAIEEKRGFWLKVTFILLGASVPAGLISFLLSLRFSEYSSFL